MDAITDPANLQQAWTHVRTKNSAGGIDDVTVSTFAQHADGQLDTLREELRTERYVPDALRELAIPKHDGKNGKRTLRLLTVRDKIAQQAVRAVIEPRIDRTFKRISFGYRPHRGAGAAIALVRHYLAAVATPWVVTADIHDCFPSVGVDRLLSRLSAVVPDAGVTRLVELWCRMGGVSSDGEWRDADGGIPQGAVLSPLLANLYLDSFDQAMLGRNARLVRYADDFLMVAATHAEASALFGAARGYLSERLGLQLNAESGIHSLADEFCWLGIRFHTGTMDVDPARVERASRTLDAWVAASDRMPVSNAIAAFNRHTDGWRRYYGRVVGRDGVRSLDQLAVNAAAAMLKKARATGRLRNMSDALSTAREITFPIDRAPAERKRLEATIARGMVPDDGPPVVQPGADPERLSRSVASAVRRRKAVTLASRAPGMHLLITEPGSFVGKQGDALVVRRERKTVLRTPVAQLRTVSLATHGVSLSTDVAVTCALHGVPLLLVGPRNEPLVTISQSGGCDSGIGVLQLRAASSETEATELARAFVYGKIHNQSALVKYVGKYRVGASLAFAHASAAYAEDVRARLAELKQLGLCGDIGTTRARVMSIEGRAAAAYWDMFRHAAGARVSFSGREHRGARDLVNSLLNYGYAILETRTLLAIRQARLEPQISFLHAPQGGTPTLVFDLMEEFRPLIDKVVLALLGRRRALGIDGDGLLTHDTRQLLGAQVSKQLVALVPYRGLHQRVEEVMRLQALALAAHLEGARCYRPFLMRW